MTMDYCFLHGLHGSTHGTKANYLRKFWPGLIAPNLPLNLDYRYHLALMALRVPSILIGSSLGAVTALMLAQNAPEKVTGLVLLAPAIGFFDSKPIGKADLELIQSLRIPASLPCSVIAAQQDHIVPIEAVRNFIQHSNNPNCRLIEVNDEHGLGRSLDLMIEQVKVLAERCQRITYPKRWQTGGG